MNSINLIISFIVYFSLFFLPSLESSADYTTLVYKDCASQTFTDPTKSQSQAALSSLFQELVAHSSQSKFFKAVGGGSEAAVSGLFQCRGDISEEECYRCVNTVAQMSNSLCSQAMAARVQLFGCYTHYEAGGFHETSTSKTNLRHNTCGESKVAANGFVELWDAAFAALIDGIVHGNGFYTTNYESVQVMAQCEGDLGGCECGECVSNAEQIAHEECGESVSGEIYLDKCFISYTFNPDGIPANPHPENNQRGNNNSNGKVAAIVVGGAAALFLGFMFLLLIKSWGKKEDD
ncbi:plasmodesmata-located protein 3-like [Corylus avellana]|uniref:plasmodesmata-located protein 3-like n=1 Tax=Corylus avellana TaxID=13451 RepID=UPI001E21F0BF|nr:plasmodesmata-located protein 3-like [Corylus avellana]